MPMITSPERTASDRDLERARALGSATLLEARPSSAALPSSIKPLAQKFSFAGSAFTVQVPPGDNLWLHHALALARPGDVLVASAAGGLEHGYFGEVMAESAVARGLAALVIEGGVRDSAQIAVLGFPVFSERICIRGTTKDAGLAGALRRPVVIGGVTVRPGDLLVGDADGVVVVPASEIDTTIAAGIEREEKERHIIERLRAGESTVDIYGLPAVPGGVGA